MFTRLYKETIHNEPKHFIDKEKVNAKIYLDIKNRNDYATLNAKTEVSNLAKKSYKKIVFFYYLSISLKLKLEA